MGPNATGGRQTDQGPVTQRLKTGGNKKYARGFDNSGNIEGNIYAALAAARCLPAVPPRPPRGRKLYGEGFFLKY
jgi:hypothetical protein